MSTSNSLTSITHPQISVFNGESYEFWVIKMKTLFKLQGLWEYVERGYEGADIDDVKKDSKVLISIYSWSST